MLIAFEARKIIAHARTKLATDDRTLNVRNHVGIEPHIQCIATCAAVVGQLGLAVVGRKPAYLVKVDC